MKKRNKCILLALIISALVLLFSCETTPAPQIEGLETASSFMKSNVSSISMHKLDNGMTVIIKKQPSNRIYSMRVMYNGGVAMLPQGKDGIETLTLAMMLRGSKKYSYDDITKISFEHSSAMTSGTGLDMSWLSLNTIDKYWNTMLDVFTDSILNPVFDEEQFKLVKHNANMQLQKEMTDPYEFTVTQLHKNIHKGHPYGMEARGTEESIANMNIADLKNWHADKLTADRMFIVAVGNFKPSKLVAELNKTLGKIPVKENPIPEIKPFEIKQNLYTEEFAGSDGIGYIRGDYVIPPSNTKDFTTLQLAYGILGDLLFSIVRTDHAACYSVWANAHGYKAPYGSLVVFKTDQPANAKRYYDEAIAVLASGKTMNIKGQSVTGGEGHVSKASGPRYAPIEESLDSYKAKFVNGFFGDQLTNADLASQIAASYAYFGNPYEYLRFIDKINSITPKDITRVVNQYIVNGQISWIVVSDKASLSKLDKSQFMKFTGKVEK